MVIRIDHESSVIMKTIVHGLNLNYSFVSTSDGNPLHNNIFYSLIMSSLCYFPLHIILRCMYDIGRRFS